jgi:hypothetical protein
VAVIESERVHLHLPSRRLLKLHARTRQVFQAGDAPRANMATNRNDTIESKNNFGTHSCRVGGGTPAGQSVLLAELLLDHLQLACNERYLRSHARHT